MFPLRDENPTSSQPVATLTIIVLCALSWALLQGFGNSQSLAHSLCSFGMIPAKLFALIPKGTRVPVGGDMYCVMEGQRGIYTIISHMFMHGGWFHLIGNMWFLWIFGDNVEDSMGPFRFAIFYILCGLVAAGTQLITDTSSALPMVGASGAIGGVMGGYGRLYPHAKVHTLLILGFLFTTVSMPAYVMLGYWFLLQLIAGIPSLSAAGGGVAFWAHVGGFAAGYVLVTLFRKSR